MSTRRSDAEKRNIVRRIEEAVKSSGLTVKEACAAHGISDSSYYLWRKQLREEKTEQKETDSEESPVEAKVVELKREHPYYGLTKICKQLLRSHGIIVDRRQVARILEKHNLLDKKSAGPRRKKGTRRFERLDRNELWQMDIMYYRLKQAGRFYLISVLDDYSRFICAHRVCTIQSAQNVIDTFKEAVERHGIPKQVLTDRGSQFHAWKGISRFDEMLNRLGVKHILPSPQSPQTIGKIESWHRNIQRELLRQREFETIEEARDAIADYVDYYNHERVHMGINYVTPADRYFGVASDVQKLMKNPGPGEFYLTGRVDGQPFRVEQLDEERLVVKLAGKQIKTLGMDEIKSLLL